MSAAHICSASELLNLELVTSWIFLTSATGPASSEVPVSAMAWHPFSQNDTPDPLTDPPSILNCQYVLLVTSVQVKLPVTMQNKTGSTDRKKINERKEAENEILNRFLKISNFEFP